VIYWSNEYFQKQLQMILDVAGAQINACHSSTFEVFSDTIFVTYPAGLKQERRLERRYSSSVHTTQGVWQRAEGRSLHKPTLSLVLLITDGEMSIITWQSPSVWAGGRDTFCQVLTTFVLVPLC